MSSAIQSVSVQPAFVTRLRAASQSLPVALVGGVVYLFLLSQVLIPLPFSPVPISLGSFAALSLGAMLGARRGMLATAAYAALGAAGLPVFAGFGAGFMTASFGYVLGYILAAGLVGYWVHSSRTGRGFASSLLIALTGSAVIYAAGLAWMVAAFQLPVVEAVSLGVTPFLLGDLVKCFAVASLVAASTLHRSRR